MKIIECPRDAMQGIKSFIPTQNKIKYLNSLLKIGFDTLDFGSFVSPKAIPQMQDTPKIVDQLELKSSNTKLLAIIANIRGAKDAADFDKITYLGYPFSISETFQQRNTKRGIEEAFDDVKVITQICDENAKELVIYISMGFGNPYGDEWNTGVVKKWVEKLAQLNLKIISLADTVGSAKPEDISYLFKELIPAFPDIEFGAHFHSRPDNWREKINAAYTQGCRRFDAAVKGFGGCPMAKDDLVGNVATENLIAYLQEKGEKLNLDMEHWSEVQKMAVELMG